MPRIELLVFDGCPNARRARDLVDPVIRSLEVGAAAIDVVVVDDDAAAKAHRFLGSPTIRVDGRDIDPHAEGRANYALTCRVYETASGLAGLPDEAWLREALTRSAP